ncbi:unnamed protein product [Linum tenue]|uniref:Uncharacterized protein n=1 Tax=Linum tenue TaxID=586396 RepID=A0AAV0IRI3_9ROSI|nr:unnamed protein product [Linum tenue]
MAGREVREYTNLTDPKDKKWGKGKDKIDDEDVTFQRMVAKNQRVRIPKANRIGQQEITQASDNIAQDPGLSHGVDDADRCKKLLENAEDIFMGEAHWTVMTYFISRSRWKLKRMLNGSSGVRKREHLLLLKYPFVARNKIAKSINVEHLIVYLFHTSAATLADTTPATVPLPLRVEPKPKSGIRQQDLLKKVVEVKPKRPRVSSNHGSENPKHENCRENKEEESDLSTSTKPECENKPTKVEAEGDSVKSLLGLAYESSDDEED